ncbi:hypothetical protein GCM10011356_11090 [Kangiella profundi]|nr:hypothetical protein GCM10011356_11090 [Kangiella profundi]
MALRTSNAGKAAIGIKDVAGMGIGSKIHQIAQSEAIAAVIEAGWVKPELLIKK